MSEAQDPAVPDEQPQEVEHQLLGEVGTGSIHDRLARIEGTIGYIKRGGRLQSKAANFTYATIDQLREAVRPLLGAEGVTMVPRKIKVLRSERIVTERSNDRGTYESVQFDTLLRVVWRLACTIRPEDREHLQGDGVDAIDVPSYGRSLNNSDKDFNTALTYAERNALLAIFHISSGDDPEQERPTVEGRVREPRGRGGREQAGGGYPPPTAKADPPTDEQRGTAARARMVLTSLGKVPEERFNEWVFAVAREIGDCQPTELNRKEFGVLIEKLKEQLAKNPYVPEGWDPETGEVPQAPAPPAEPAPAPPSPEAQQAIEQAAAQTRAETTPPARTDPDNPPPAPGDTFRNAVEEAAKYGVPEADVLGMAMALGAAHPNDLDEEPLRAAFLERVTRKLEEASRA